MKRFIFNKLVILARFEFKNLQRNSVNDNNWRIYFFFSVWAETGDFRESSHSSMTAVASSIDHTQLNFQTTSRNRNRDRKNDGK